MCYEENIGACGAVDHQIMAYNIHKPEESFRTTTYATSYMLMRLHG